MTDIEIKTQLHNLEDKLQSRYTLLFKILLLIGLFLILWVGIVYLGIVILGFGLNWALLSFDTWLVLSTLIIGFFVILEIALYYHFISIRNKRIQVEKPKIEFFDGKRVHVYTSPKGIEGGIFSKTYIEIDEKNVLRLRTLMIAPDALWSKKEE